jgi:4-oxalocrotonate tautomerase
MAHFGEAAAARRRKTPLCHRQKEQTVPLIQVKLIENVFSPEQKREIIERLTDAMVEVEGENMRPVTWVTIEEVASGDWGIAGNALTTADVKGLQAGVPA